MAVTVVTGIYNTGEPSQTDVFADGEQIDVTDSGHLIISTYRDGGMLNIGAYPPGKWIGAYTDEDRKFTKVDA